MRRPVLIAGAGIAGLTLALVLSFRGIASRLLERRDALSEAGAGIQLGPNAVHVLDRLGVASRLESLAGAPEAIDVIEGATGRSLAHFPLGQQIARRFGAPYRVAHRADLQATLLAAVRTRPDIELVTGFEVRTQQQTANGIGLTATDGRTAEGDMLVGADGLWSNIRRLLYPDQLLTYASKLAARTVLPTEHATERFRRPMTGVWLAGDAHVVHYPVRAGREIAIVVIVDEPVGREGWGAEISSMSVLSRLIGFSPELLAFLSKATEWRAWSLYDPPPLPSWSRGNVGLIGDAAHPILPFLAQGGGMAIEDAETLGALLAKEGMPPSQAFQVFEHLRRQRVLRVQRASRENGTIFHHIGPMALARNIALIVTPGKLMMRRYDWLYGWNGDKTD